MQRIVSLGNLPLANKLLDNKQLEAPEDTYPLTLAFCETCSLVQIVETIPPEVLFREYPYFSSVSDTMLANAEQLTSRILIERALSSDSLVVEVGSNDGYLLKFYRRAGIGVLGIEPALNIAKVAREQNKVPTIDEFFGEKLAERLAAEGSRADVIHAHNVLAHVADLNGVLRGMRLLLIDNGVAIIEVPYVRDLIERNEFDTIYHEHLCYFSVTSLRATVERNGLHLQRVERISIHGGSLRLFVGAGAEADESVDRLLSEEQQLGLDQNDYYAQLAAKMQQVKSALRELLLDLRASGKRVAAYGAAAKGATLLGFCEIGSDVIDYVVDRNVYKQKKYLPGARVKVLDPAVLLQRRPDYVLLLTWNNADEVLTQQWQYVDGGGRFIIPIPEPRVVPGDPSPTDGRVPNY